ncbi:MAG: hypothetical protein GEV03_05585 [Streptosporangiales bacterium]|nr:hypothetical protein [Streptosporangiales bacterium]
MALISDTDGGSFDSDTSFDRAVGPMQFLPGTWRAVGADGNDDGAADPGNLYDAALSAGRYLCAGPVNLNDPAQLRAAVYRYNQSSSYVDLVLALAAAYRNGGEPTGPIVAAGRPPKPLDGDLPPATVGRPPAAEPGASSSPSTGRGSPSGGSPSDSSSPTGSPGKPSTSPSPPSPSPPSPTPPSPTPPSPTPSPTPSPPTVVALSPDAGPTGPTGTKVTISGSGLRKANASFGGVPAATRSASDGRLVVTAPNRDRVGQVAVKVTGPGGTATADGGYTYLPAITSIDPESVRRGGTVTVHGTGFGEDSTVGLTNPDTDTTVTRATDYASSKGTLTFVVPDDLRPGTYQLAATTDGVTGAPVSIKVTKA